MFPLDALIEQGDKALLDGLHDLALQFYQRALAEHGENYIIYEKLGTACLSIENIVEAIQCFTKSLQLNPKSLTSCLNLAQLNQGKDALSYYQCALPLIQDDETKIQVYCSMSEIYLTDCCDEPDAESQIESFLNICSKLDPNHHQYLITFASLRISQSRPEDAKEFLNLFFKNLSKDLESIPDYDSRISAIKLCIETQLYDNALDLLGVNLQIDEDDGETWYLFGWIYYLFYSEGDVDYESDMMECWDRLALIQEKKGNIDPDLLEHIHTLKFRVKDCKK